MKTPSEPAICPGCGIDQNSTGGSKTHKPGCPDVAELIDRLLEDLPEYDPDEDEDDV